MKRLQIFLPGLLMAATGVGAGDLLTASFAGQKAGTMILWAVVLGALLKFGLTEGLTRWQMATETTLLEGWIGKLGQWIQWVFIIYLLFWSIWVGGALISACSSAFSAFFSRTEITLTQKILWGSLHSGLGWALVRFGSFKFFERIMAICIALMFGAVLLTAILLEPAPLPILKGLVFPRIPPQGGLWVFGLIGGVGGTLTILSYGYWIREHGRKGEMGLKRSRIDLAGAYVMTALFSIALIIINSSLPAYSAQKSNLPLVLARQLELGLGPIGFWVFLIGFWAAVFSSLLGVWQSVPLIYSDFNALRYKKRGKPFTSIDEQKYYRRFLGALAIVSLAGLALPLKRIQLIYAVVGAFFLPLLALTLLIMNNHKEWVHRKFRNGFIANGLLISCLIFFLFMSAISLQKYFSP